MQIVVPISSAGLDLDEVILDFDSLAIERFNRKYGKNFNKSDIVDFDWYEDLYGISLNQFLEDLIELRVLEDAVPFEGAPEAVQALMDAGVHVSIVTSRGFHPEARAITERWLKQHGLPYDRLEIVASGRKKSEYFSLPVDVFVDDHLKNHRDMIKNGRSDRCFVIANTWNDPARNDVGSMERRLEYCSSLQCVVNQFIRKAA